MRYFLKPLILTAILAICITPSVKSQGFLKVNGKRIVNDTNSDFILRGMGLGGYMLQEGYMFHLGFLGQQYKIREKIAAFSSENNAAEFYKSWLQFHTKASDIDSLASWGFNSVRLPMHYALFTLPVEDEPVKGKNTWLAYGFQLVDSLLHWCKTNNLYLILDLHAAPGGQGNDLAISDRNPEKPSLWESRENQAKTIALWKKIGARYATEESIGGYDILNETNWGFKNKNDKRGIDEKENEPLRELLIEITNAIRSVDKHHIIFLEGNGFANNYNGIFPLWDKNMVISFHKYGNFATKESIQKFLDLRDKYNVPLWLGECGENSNTWFRNTIRLMEDNNIGWCWWQLKKMGINNPLEIKQPTQYSLFQEFCRGKVEKPDSIVANTILNEWLENLKSENNIFHPDVVDAMFRQVYSNETFPFKHHLVDTAITVLAADYDMGRNNCAYRDADTATYIYTPGVNTRGNRGHAYRNDGVDIRIGAGKQPEVFSIEAGEWMVYTIDAPEAGLFDLFVTTDSSHTGNSITLILNGKVIEEGIEIQGTSLRSKTSDTVIRGLTLEKGSNKIKIIFDNGGLIFKFFTLERVTKS